MGSLGETSIKEPPFAVPGPILIELKRLENNLRETERELRAAQHEIRALKMTEVLKDKAVMELSNELKKLEEKLRTTEKHLEYKSLEIKKLNAEKKEALAAQFASEAALRRLHASQKDEKSIPIEAVIAPLESDIRMYKNEIGKLQEDKKALERLTKSKEAALIEAERILRSTLERALIVETVQNQNVELRRKIEILQDENKLLEKVNRQKVVEIDKLAQTIQELEETNLAGGTTANVVRDFQRQVSDLHEEKKLLERELARAKVSANRVATVVANEWKDENEKVMPIKQWLEERKFLQVEIQRLRDKLSILERTAKAEAQLKGKFILRLKTLEEGLKQANSLANKQHGNTEQGSSFSSSNVTLKKRSASQPRASFTANRTSATQHNSPSKRAESPKSIKRTNSLKSRCVGGDSLVKKNMWASRSKVCDATEKEKTEGSISSNGHGGETKEIHVSGEARENELQEGNQDMVSGFLYDRLQREVINLRRTHEEKNTLLNAKDDEIKILLKKIDTLTKVAEAAAKKVRREAAIREKETALSKQEDNKQKISNTSLTKRTMKHFESPMKSRS